MDNVMQMLTDAVSALLPVIATTLAPVLVAGAKVAIGDKLPASLKPVLNALFGALIAGAFGVDPTVGVVGAMVGNRVREAAKS
jgi:hypothetical protein